MTEPNATEIVLEIEGLEGVPLEVRDVVIEEAMSTLSEIRVVAQSFEPIDAETVLAKRLTLRMTSVHRRIERSCHGIVFEASLSIDDDTHRLELVARPRVARLALGMDSRIFQDMSVPDVVQKVLEDAGVPSDAFELSLSGSYEPQPYITQLNESDQDFVQRLLHEEGISYFVQHDIDAEKVVFFDDDGAFTSPEAYEGPVQFAPEEQEGDAVATLREVRRVASDKVMLRDYDFLKPSNDLSSKDEADDATGREVYLHPGDFLEPSRGDRLAKVALERLQVPTRVFEGEGTVAHLEPGRYFELIGHPRAELNMELLVIAVAHRGELTTRSEGVLKTRFVAVPRATPYRADVQVPAPIVGGTHVAFVTGASGEELHGSENGQVKVRFPWDRSGITDDKSSTWLRVGQIPIPGSMVVPRVGFEVLVDYELGDHDRPLVVGHLYNGDAMPPYALPGGATVSSIQTNTTGGSGGANELRFEDKAGQEEMFVNASHDYTCSVENDARSGVKAAETSSVGGNHSVSVTGSYNSVVSAARSLTVAANQTVGVGADYSSGTGGSLTVTVGSRVETCGGDLTETVNASYSLDVGGLMSITGIAGINRNIVAASSTSVGGALLEMTASDRMSTCGGSRTETIGALKMVKAATVAISCGAAYVENAASETVKAGGNRIDSGAAISVTAGGGLKVKAANINISGKSKVIFKIGGTTIKVLPDSVTIDSSTIKMIGVKKLQSASGHETT
ncbi:MAG: type VI secretion system Vgr family protein [Sandaracinaceae bacterium]